MDFDTAFAALIGNEGGYSLDPHDRGNWTGGAINVGQCRGTKFGISAAQYPSEDIATLTLDRAKAIYLKDYWGKAGCDVVPDALKFDLFDMAVNSGQGNAIRTLQRCVGATVDGILGNQTLMAIQNYDAGRLAARFNGARLLFITASAAWESQGKGLVNRIANNLLRA